MYESAIALGLMASAVVLVLGLFPVIAMAVVARNASKYRKHKAVYEARIAFAVWVAAIVAVPTVFVAAACIGKALI